MGERLVTDTSSGNPDYGAAVRERANGSLEGDLDVVALARDNRSASLVWRRGNRIGRRCLPKNRSPREPTTGAGTPQADELGRLLIKIERLRRVVTTAFLALKHQNVERDWDIACALQFSVVDPMYSLEEEGWQLVVTLGGKALEDERL